VEDASKEKRLIDEKQEHLPLINGQQLPKNVVTLRCRGIDLIQNACFKRI